jgi:hypothetical protein
MIAGAIKRLFRPAPPAASEVVVIDQGAYYDVLARRQQRWREDEEDTEREQERIAYLVWEWARDVVRDRGKRPLPAKLPRTGVVRDWLNGLYVQELFALANSDGWSIRHHIYAGALIEGVRRVQPLAEAELRFPEPKISTEDVFRGSSSGDGPRRR